MIIIVILIADRLEALDQSYAYKAEQESQKSQASLEDRLASFQSDLETRYKRQFEAEMMLYRTRELAKVREEEREKYQRELSKEKDEMHRNYQLRLEETRKSEQRVMERYRMKEQVSIDLFIESIHSFDLRIIPGIRIRDLFSASKFA